MTRSELEAEAQKEEILEQVEIESRAKSQGWAPIFHPTPAVRRMLIVVILVALAHQLSGLEAITYYTPRVFRDTGIKKDNLILGFQAGMGILKTITYYTPRVFRDTG